MLKQRRFWGQKSMFLCVLKRYQNIEFRSCFHQTLRKKIRNLSSWMYLKKIQRKDLESLVKLPRYVQMWSHYDMHASFRVPAVRTRSDLYSQYSVVAIPMTCRWLCRASSVAVSMATVLWKKKNVWFQLNLPLSTSETKSSACSSSKFSFLYITYFASFSGTGFCGSNQARQLQSKWSTAHISEPFSTISTNCTPVRATGEFARNEQMERYVWFGRTTKYVIKCVQCLFEPTTCSLQPTKSILGQWQCDTRRGR